MTQNHFPTHWVIRLIALIEAINDHEQWRFFTAWATAEGGTAKWNPLNTTLPINDYWDEGDYNSTGVKNYKYAIAGIVATALTLSQRNADGSYLYSQLWTNLHDENLTAEQIVALSRADIKKWGTNPDTILSILGGLA